MKDLTKQKGFIKYIVLFVLIIVFIAMFDIDLKSIYESAFVQEIVYYIKVILQYIYDAFNKVFGDIQSGDVTPLNLVSTSTPKLP